MSAASPPAPAASRGAWQRLRQLPWWPATTLALLLATALVRVALLAALPDVFRFELTGAIHGSGAYDTYARNWLATGVFGRVPGTADALLPPGASVALAGLYALAGRGGWQVGLWHTALDVISVWLLTRLGVALFAGWAGVARARAIGLIAGLFTALYPYLLFHNLTVIDTPLFMALLLGFLLAAAHLRTRPTGDARTLGIGLLAGTLLGAAMLTRSSAAPFALVVAAWFLARRTPWQTFTRLLPVALLSGALLLGWGLRNVQVAGAFAPFGLNGGPNLYQGNNLFTVPYLRAGYDAQWVPAVALDGTPLALDGLDDAAQDRALAAAGWAYLRAFPERLPELWAVKLAVHWSVPVTPRRNPTSSADVTSYDGVARAAIAADGTLLLDGLPANDPVDAYSRPLFDQVGRAVHVLYFGGLLALALAGLGLTWRAWRDVSLLWLAHLAMTALYVFYHPATRYRAPYDPLLFLFSAAALVWLAGRVWPGRAAVSSRTAP